MARNKNNTASFFKDPKTHLEKSEKLAKKLIYENRLLKMTKKVRLPTQISESHITILILHTLIANYLILILLVCLKIWYVLGVKRIMNLLRFVILTIIMCVNCAMKSIARRIH